MRKKEEAQKELIRKEEEAKRQAEEILKAKLQEQERLRVYQQILISPLCFKGAGRQFSISMISQI
jgi:hypothetical protein